MYGFSPTGSEKSLKSFMIYFATLGEVAYDPKTNLPIRATLQSIVQKIMTFLPGMIMLGLYSSFLYHYDFEIYDTGVKINSFDHSIRDMLSFGHIVNNFSLAGKNLTFLMIANYGFHSVVYSLVPCNTDGWLNIYM